MSACDASMLKQIREQQEMLAAANARIALLEQALEICRETEDDF